ncbi:ATP binding protein [Fimbriiglobus ruber]|uniref:ATP binding protein n=1 Tax=Fimbriiglobus ruber TaxID=1908690 RepID=A0A225D7V8_9BACT|nr:ATP binding protein [Fimbriiglobus ruber]
MNLLVGENGSGKSTVLQAIALTTLGPAAQDAKLPVRPLARFDEPGKLSSHKSTMEAQLLLHEQDGTTTEIESRLEVWGRGELEGLRYRGKDKRAWAPVFSSENEAFFCVAYGATRRIDAGESAERGAPPKSSFLRAQRMQSIFQDSYSLFPLPWWLPNLQAGEPDRYSQVIDLMNQLLKPAEYRFTGERKGQEYLFERGSTRVPLPSLSDGYRAFIAWVADLLYHVCHGCPPGKSLVESRGVVLVDEIDLHLHPRWQMQVVETVANTFPRMQFFFTSHSPLVAGSLEWMNIIALKNQEGTNRTAVERFKRSIHGLDADQILLSEFFGLTTTRAPGKVRQLEELSRRARHGDEQAAREIILAMARGTEAVQ